MVNFRQSEPPIHAANHRTKAISRPPKSLRPNWCRKVLVPFSLYRHKTSNPRRPEEFEALEWIFEMWLRKTTVWS